MQIYIGADHRGFELKEVVKQWLVEQGYEVEDVGNHAFDPEDDYIDPAVKVAEMVEGSKEDKGILICGSGHGMDIVANRFPGARAVIGYNDEVVAQGREDEDANVLVIGADWTSEEEVVGRAEIFLRTERSDEVRHVRRRQRIADMRAR